MKIIHKLKDLSHTPRKKLGQNFLVNENAILKIVNETIKDKPKKIIEIGPGLGSLTDHLIKNHSNVLLIEKEKKFINNWSNTKLINDDALKINWDQFIEPKTTLVSNLPYKISSRVVVDRSMDKLRLDKMVLMFQKEVAIRIMAKKSTPQYGLLSVIAQNFWHISKLIKLGPKDFYPHPKIFSQVLVFNKKDEFENKKAFLNFMKKAFSNRRKKLITNMPNLKTILDDLKINQNIRAQDLSPIEFKKLFKKII